MVIMELPDDSGFILVDKYGRPVSARIFSDVETAEEYCEDNGFGLLSEYLD